MAHSTGNSLTRLALVVALAVIACRPGLAKNGYVPLEARVAEADLVVVGKRVDVKESLEALVLARNTSEKAIQLLDYPVDGAVTISAVDPDGQPMRVALYPQFRAGYELKLNRYHLTCVPAGGIVCLQHTRLPMSPKAGVFKIGATYVNQRDATALKVTVWKGKIEAPTLDEKVPQDAAD